MNKNERKLLIKKVRKLSEKGFTQREIAKMVGRSTPTINSYLSKTQILLQEDRKIINVAKKNIVEKQLSKTNISKLVEETIISLLQQSCFWEDEKAKAIVLTKILELGKK